MSDPLRAEIERLAKLEVLAWNLENPGCSREWCAKLLRDFIQRERTALLAALLPAEERPT